MPIKSMLNEKYRIKVRNAVGIDRSKFKLAYEVNASVKPGTIVC